MTPGESKSLQRARDRTVHVELLGPLKILRYGEEVPMPAAKTQIIFATLVLDAGATVPTYRLVDELWGDNPPASATRTVQTYVYHIRRRLSLGDNRAIGDTDRSLLLTRPGGYELRLPDSTVVDAVRFTTLLETARRQVDDDQLAESAGTLRTALGLWRGAPLAGLPAGPLLSVARVRLEQARVSALELRIDSELALGRHRGLVDELHALVLADPTHEGYSTRLMTALHRSGRRTEAMEVFHRLRRQLDTELGVSPSAEVQRVFYELLNDNPASQTTTRRSTIVTDCERHAQRQLPPRPELIGRDIEEQLLCAALSGSPRTETPRVVELLGGPGMGTSSFTAHAAHKFGEHYRDGAIVVDLADVDDETDARLLAERLAAGGVPVPRSAGFAEVTQAFQSWVRQRQLLVIVDHVASARLLAQLRPCGNGSALVAVNRFGVPGQVGDSIVEIRPLPPSASRSLLTRTAGEDRIPADEGVVTTLTELCEGNPFVLCAVGRWMSCRRQVPVVRLVRELVRDHRRLARLWWGGRSIDESVRNHLRGLSEDAVRVLNVLSPTAERLSPTMVATALTLEPDRAEAVLDELTGVHLLDEVTSSEAAHRAFRIRAVVSAAMSAERVPETDSFTPPTPQPAWSRTNHRCSTPAAACRSGR